MKLINKLLGIIATALLFGFVFVWLFMPDKKQEIKDWWYGATIDCDQMQRELINDQQCKLSNDCTLSRKESIRADKLEAQYNRYCGST